MKSPGRPVLVAVGGLIASGKSTAARRLAAALDAELLVADEIRGELAHDHPSDALRPGFSTTVYAELFAEAERILGAGRPVVLDGTFRSRDLRSQARAVASRCDVPFRFVECRADAALCRERLRSRANAAGWLAIFERFLCLWEPPDELSDDERAVLDTSHRAPLDSVESLLRL